MGKFALVLATAVLGSGSTVIAAQGVLSSVRQPLVWSGKAGKGSNVGEVPECKDGCQRFDLKLQLSPNTWKRKPGGLQVAIRWVGLTSAMAQDSEFNRRGRTTAAPTTGEPALGDNLRLYVYKDGFRVAASEGESSLAQSVLLPTPPNGPFQVYVAFDAASPSPEIAYEGLAEVEYFAAGGPPRKLLPDLAARPQRHVTFDPGPIFAKAISPAAPSCYYTEVEEEGARTCLRFDQVFTNVGEGPMEVRFSVPRGSIAPTHPAVQRIYSRGGDTAFQDRKASEVEFHPGHSHYHVMTFALSRLWSVDDDTDRKKPTGLKFVRSGKKISFCMVDTELEAWAQKGDGPKTWKAPDCNYPVSSDGTGDHYAQGITNGWKDVYEWYLPHQYIEVTGVPDGLYILETRADPNGLLLESDKANNCGSIYIWLSNVASNSRKAEIRGPGPACHLLAETH